MRLRAKDRPESIVIYIYTIKRTRSYNVNHNADLPIEVNQRIHNARCSFRTFTLELYNRPSALFELKIRILRAEILETILYDCVTWSPHACHYNTLRRAHHSFLTCCNGLRNKHRATPRIHIWARLSRRNVRASRRLCARGGSFRRDLWRA